MSASARPAVPPSGIETPCRLYVSASHDEAVFRDGPHGYWLPNVGRLAFHPDAGAARDEAADLGGSSLSTPASIFLSSVALHTKTSYAWFYDRFGGPPARLAFDRPALVLSEHEAEDPRRRDGAGFTTASEAGLRAQPRQRWIVIGFDHPRFALPQSRDIASEAGFKGRLWTIETSDVEIVVT